MKWFWWLILGPDVKVVRVRWWMPSMGPWGVEWPVMIVDRLNGRETIVPVWDKARLVEIWERLNGNS